ncbi:ABC transporter ATP-binding protein [Endozoicomonas montiporae]|uniref:Lipopolysaccharide transport system ATP-binding protein n=1 Tax=Endozoicomonas montiporae CL-33 TaxID=570277 RepID=A0A142BDK9_9GAMM|nr:ABC transporter ATP-binding protein [Endozoicomonas montiporae]AMO56835.1 lipopolysaccharide transport system ATP-binding protein [Endozoicomonas montiporae CL-33]
MNAITVKNLGKAYKQYHSKWDRLAEWFLPGKKQRHSQHWVLQDINFTIQLGEAVGIIGVNGAGKSTLLKMITGTTQPTTGTVEVNGRVAALLELGMGFHPDFTGRENIFMSGQLMGLSIEDIQILMPKIEAFAEVGDYIDQPVRVYSSGMQARVAFSVATMTSPDILIVDEALSVGDFSFQAKCIQHMKNLLDSGVAILFVSHSLSQVRKFCNRTLYLADSYVKGYGNTDKICDLYQNDQALKVSRKNHKEVVFDSKKTNHYQIDEDLRKNSVALESAGTMELEFKSFQALDENGCAINNCNPQDTVIFRASIQANADVNEGASVGLLLGDQSGYPILSCNSNYYSKKLPSMQRGDCIVITWKIIIPFYSGDYRIDIGIKPDFNSPIFYDRVFCARKIAINTPIELLNNNFGGIFYAPADVEIHKLSL